MQKKVDEDKNSLDRTFFKEDFKNFKIDYESKINLKAYFKISHAIRNKLSLNLHEINRFHFKRAQFTDI